MYLIASWGSSGAGKTTVALALAAAFAQRREDVLILSSDTRTPALPVMLPNVKGIDGRSSLGPLLSTPITSEAELKDKMIRHPRNSHIYVMGFASGETPTITYSTPTRAAALSLFQLLMQTPFAYVIVDCDSSPLYDQMTLAALEYAQAGVMVCTPDVKGFEFQKAQTSWLANSDVFHLDRFFHVASPVYPFSPMSDARALFGGFECELPHSQEVAERMMAGEQLEHFSTKAGVIFEKNIRRLADKLEDEVISRGQQ